MRIFSKFHDYYDIGLSRGHDDRILYVRQEKKMGSEPSSMQYTGVKSGSYGCSGITIGFCGKIYSLVEFRFYNGISGVTDIQFCYSIEELTNEFKKFGIPVSTDVNGKYRMYSEIGRYQKFFETGKSTTYGVQYKRNLQDIFIKNKVPIFRIDGPQITLNPILKDVKFFRIFDSYSAYQEIEMYIGGVLGSIGKEIPKVSDEDRFAAHGFDKQSFRMPAGRKKTRGSKWNS